MTDEWFFEVGSEIHGPVDLDELRRMVRTGRIGPGTRLRRDSEEWVAARHIPGLFDGVATDAGSPPHDVVRDDDAGPDEDYRPPPPQNGSGRAAVTAYGVATLVLASVLTITGCLSGFGSILCFAGFNALMPPAGPAAPPPGAAPQQWAGCGAMIQMFVGVVLLALAIVLAVVMAVHLLLGGGHFAVGVGVLRRRPWARIIALVLSVFTAAYGLLALYQVGSLLAQPSGPGGPDPIWLVIGGIVGLLFVGHAVLSWVVMFHPACAGEFRAERAYLADDRFSE